MDRPARHRVIRKAAQFLAGIAANGNFSGFVTGQIYSGKLKGLCVPGMNCYSCPGALGACPIGSLQAFFTSKRPRFPFYVLGWLVLIGVMTGRSVCGWLCPFGLIQELLHKIPIKKITVPERADRMLRKLKYVFLAVFVILLPIMLRDEMGMSVPYFCKYICPVGMLEGGIPLLILNKALRPAAHLLYVWKFAVLIAVASLSVVINRPFCKYMCPLGAFYGLFQKVSFLKLKYDQNACTGCGACSMTCRMQVDPVKAPNSAECIRCGECVKACPTGALAFNITELMKNRNVDIPNGEMK